MPSKSKRGASPLGSVKLQGSNRLDTSSAFARTELEMSRRTPLQSMTTGAIQLPGGRMHVPKRRQRGRGGGGGPFPWKASLSSVEGVYTVSVTEGYLFAGLLNPERITFETEEGEDNYEDFAVEVVANDVVCIKYTYATTEPAVDAFVTIEAVAGGTDFATFDPTEDDGEDPPVTTASFYPLAKVIDTGEVDADNNAIFELEQMARNHLALVTLCVNGSSITSFAPI